MDSYGLPETAKFPSELIDFPVKDVFETNTTLKIIGTSLVKFNSFCIQ